ncbi:MAG TPA: hypothetical protein EYG92_05470 [Lutibacter sp.]|nr:hypothetical protein [Lutibacter sp.]
MHSKTTLLLLKTSTFLVFIGRAYQHLFWDAPFRSLLWDEQLLKPIVQGLFGVKWHSYVTDLVIDSSIQSIIQLHGILYLLAAIAVVLIQPNSKRWMRIVLYLGGFNLVFLAFLLFKEKSYQIPQFFEHSLQFGVVFTLLYYLKRPNYSKLLFYLKVLIALTFFSHGIYALGVVYPIPSDFITMMLNITPLTETFVIDLLFLIGVLDILLAFLIFIPKLAKWVLLYAFVWGSITALARITSGLQYEISLMILHQYLFESLYRIVHGLIPLLAFLLTRNLSSS